MVRISTVKHKQQGQYQFKISETSIIQIKQFKIDKTLCFYNSKLNNENEIDN